MVYLRESVATAVNILTARKQCSSYKAPSRNENQPHVMVMSLFLQTNQLVTDSYIMFIDLNILQQ